MEINLERKGSVLIVLLWALIGLSMLALSVTSRSRMAAKIEGYDTKKFQRSYDYLAAVNLARFYLESDSSPEQDSRQDSWYGIPQDFRGTDFEKRFEMNLTDEESKININDASGELLRILFEILRDRGIRLRTDPKDLAASIAAWRGSGTAFGDSSLGFEQKGAPFESLEELYFIQHCEPEDIALIRPYLTVYGTSMGGPRPVNINTAHRLVLEAVIRSLPGGRSEKDLLVKSIETFRDPASHREGEMPFFNPEDLNASALMMRLGLQPSLEMSALVTFFCHYVTVDSKVFSLRVFSKISGEDTFSMQAVLGPRTQSFGNTLAEKLEILSWQEGLTLSGGARKVSDAGGPAVGGTPAL